MSLTDNKGNKGIEPTLSGDTKTGGENAHDENAGLPSVNRNKGNNKLVTILGFLFIIGAASALVVSVNSDKQAAPKPKKSAPEQISNNMPPLVIPPAPAPIEVGAAPTLTAPAQNGPQPANNTGAAGTKPIPVHNSASGRTADGRPVLDWTDRKMAGSLLVGGQTGISSNAASTQARPATDGENGVQPVVLASAGGVQKSDWGAKLEPTITKGVSATILPDRNFIITKGTALDCALETALDSTVPGMTTCRLTRDVYSDNGQVLLLDRGSQLVGEYQGGLKQGQVRLFVLWSRVKTPNGVIVSLNSPGTDALGRAGLEGWVDNHFAERFGAAFLMSFIKDSIAAMLAREQQTSGTVVYGGTVNAGEKVVEKILEATANIPPTMVKNQGDHIQVMVARDLDFASVYGLRVKQ